MKSWKYMSMILLLGVCQNMLSGQETDSPIFDTNYIEDVSDQLAVRVYGINKFNRFSIHDNELNQEIRYSPNNNLNLGFGVNYKWFGLGIAFNFPFINNDDEIYGKTTRIDAQTNIFTQKFLIDFYLHQYRGFYIENPEDYLDEWEEGDAYPHRPDVTTSTIGGSFMYILNNTKYSAKAAFVQNQFQKRSAGSFLFGGYFSIYGLQGDSSLIPSALSDVFNPDLQFKRIQSQNLGIVAGYSHNFVLWKKFYISLTLVPGVSVQGYGVYYDDSDENTNGTLISGRFLARAAFVYNWGRSFAGLTTSNDSFGSSAAGKNSNLNFEVGVVRFFYGRRFYL